MSGERQWTIRGYPGLPEPTEYARVTPSVRLARWLDADPEREVDIQHGVQGWVVQLADKYGHEPPATGATRDEAITAALDAAEAGATTEGEQHDEV